MKLSFSFAVTALLLLLVTIGFACQGNKNTVADQGLYYFPAKNVYYDSRQSQYYYSLDAGTTWDSLPYKGTEPGKYLGTKIAIGRSEGNSWMNNESDRKKYNGVLLNIVNNQTRYISRNDSITKSKTVAVVVKKPVIVTEANPEKPKGLKKFFNKLFGKKKKPAEEKKQ